MSALRLVVAELFGLFVDDGRLAAWILALVLAIGVLVRLLPDQAAYLGVLLTLGCLAILVDGTVRARR